MRPPLTIPAFVALVLAGAGSLYAQAARPAITGAEAVPAYRLARLSLDGLPDGASAVWEVYPFAADGIEGDGGRSFAFVGPPAVYQVSAVYLIDGTLGKARYTVTIGEPQRPQPPPVIVEPDDPVRPVDPERPDDDPAPVAGPLWIYAVYESRDVTPQQATVLRDKALWDAIGKAGHSYRHFDVDDAASGGTDAAAARSAIDAVRKLGVGLPAVLFVSPSGDAIRGFPLPDSGQGLWSAVKEATGKP